MQWRSPSDIDDEIFFEALAIVHSPEVILSRIPFEGAVETVNAIAAEHDILYLTNRDGQCQDATRQWLTDRGFPEPGSESVNLVCTMEDKIALTSHCQYLIDDRPKTLVQFVYNYEAQRRARTHPELERKGFSLMYAHNDSLTDVPGIYLAPTWSGLRWYLQEKEVIPHDRAAESGNPVPVGAASASWAAPVCDG